ncbi:Uncharacterized conserved protein YlxW, UPF0749 family [Sanguibacter gelidistatuariae]|uniref:Uncharacterized conserved protein YlxW, UPF0749 family n=1 Tax=Sanguibacter gelidistatuariae TaxID=1814289 RepID=A0A1G6H2Y6_9MICO|nr:DUF881 domain-containing protein [Sanguibacter gelidistatuariae]SDB88561.1 Uncharacterized conserved protein YlxW, UPF0749 family [Sanguibacter gelidistatuariae]
MAQQSRGTRRPLRATLSVTFVLILAGLLFTANARLSGGEENRQPENFGELVRQASGHGDDLQTEVEGLRSAVDVLTLSQATSVRELDPQLAERSGVATGLTSVSGAGLRVSLQDAPANRPQPEDIVADDLVVHQQDLEGVINALWAGGAEAMTLQGQRVTTLTAFRCVGNVLSLHGRVYSPPYVVEVIGDPAALQKALDDSPTVTVFQEYVDAVGLGYEVHKLDDVTLPAYDGVLTLEHARVPDGTDIYS